jgi:hypothetical protein
VITTEAVIASGSGGGATELYPVFSSSPEEFEEEVNETRDGFHDSSEQNNVSVEKSIFY